MQIQKIQSQTFESKQRFLNDAQRFNLKSLLGRMTSESTHTCREMTFTTKMLGALNIGKNAQFIDKRMHAVPSYNMQGTSTLEMGRTRLTFDNETGEIIKHKKPFYKCWSSVLKKAGELIQLANDNFNNKDVIGKQFLVIEGYTQKGLDALQRVMNRTPKKGSSK